MQKISNENSQLKVTLRKESEIHAEEKEKTENMYTEKLLTLNKHLEKIKNVLIFQCLLRIFFFFFFFRNQMKRKRKFYL